MMKREPHSYYFVRGTELIDRTFKYTEDHHETYEREGFCIFDKFLTDEAVRQGRQHIDRMIAQRLQGFPVGEFMSPHQLGEEWIWEIATHRKVLDLVERQIGPNIVLWHTDLLTKEPLTGSEIPWHQDQPYWNVSPPVVSLWIPFDDVDSENGSMSVLPRWHTRGALPVLKEEGKFFDLSIDPESLPANIDGMTVTYVMKAGQAAAHSPMIPHYSVPNRSNRWRRVMSLRYARAEAAQMGERHYTDYRNRSNFDRQYYLVRGEDATGRSRVRE
jgi:ectoine hydroxylase-related dioxygenase (phytanoyl-CoA dioxygenase family)